MTKSVFKRVIGLCVSLSAIALGWSCGSGSDSVTAAGNGNNVGTGRVSIRVIWPEQTRLIPMASNSIKVSLLQHTQSGLGLIDLYSLTRPNTSKTFANVPAGDLVVAAAAYPSSDSSGIAQAQGQTEVTVISGEDQTVTITMASTIDHIDVARTEVALIAGQASFALILTPKDVNGSVVLVAPAALRATSSNTSVATVDTNGNVTAVAAGTAQITVTDTESGKSTPTVNVTVFPKGTLSVYTGDTLSNGFDEGVDTSGGLRNWVLDKKGYMECQYPPGQDWGAVFLTKGPVSPAGPGRSTIDISAYHYLVLELKGASGGEQVNIGVKTEVDPDDGQEPKFSALNLTTQWQTIKIPLSQLTRVPNYPNTRFSHLYVVCELVFEQNVPSETVSFRYVRYEP